MKLSTKIDMIGGNCPVQAEGTIYDKPFYFRARGNRWSVTINMEGEDSLPFIDWPKDVEQWYHEEKYSDDEYAAGWMEQHEAIEFIMKAAEKFYDEQKFKSR